MEVHGSEWLGLTRSVTISLKTAVSGGPRVQSEKSKWSGKETELAIVLKTVELVLCLQMYLRFGISFGAVEVCMCCGSLATAGGDVRVMTESDFCISFRRASFCAETAAFGKKPRRRAISRSFPGDAKGGVSLTVTSVSFLDRGVLSLSKIFGFKALPLRRKREGPRDDEGDVDGSMNCFSSNSLVRRTSKSGSLSESAIKSSMVMMGAYGLVLEDLEGLESLELLRAASRESAEKMRCEWRS